MKITVLSRQKRSMIYFLNKRNLGKSLWFIKYSCGYGLLSTVADIPFN